MDPERCDYLAGDELIRVIPRVNHAVLHLVCGDVGPLEAGIANIVPVWMAILLKRRQQCHIVPPDWMCVDELKRLVVVEGEMTGLTNLPYRMFEIAHMLVREAKDDLVDGDQLKMLIQDLWDRREAKLNSSTFKFISQASTSFARMDNVQPVEIAGPGIRANLAACKVTARLIAHKNQQHEN